MHTENKENLPVSVVFWALWKEFSIKYIKEIISELLTVIAFSIQSQWLEILLRQVKNVGIISAVKETIYKNLCRIHAIITLRLG